MSDTIDDPYALVEEPLSGSYKIASRVSRRQVIWGILLILVALVGDLGAWSLGYREGWVVELLIGLGLAQYLAIWLLLRSYVGNKLTRGVFGVLLTICATVLLQLGFAFDFRSQMSSPFVIVVHIVVLFIYAQSSWMQGLLFVRSNFHWFPKIQARCSQFSIPMLLGWFFVCAVVALIAKSMRVRPRSFMEVTLFDTIAGGVCIQWLAMCMGLLSFLQIGAIRSRSRSFYVPLYLLAILFGPLVFQTVGYWLFSYESFLAPQDPEYYVRAYAIEAGLLLGVLAVLPLLPKRNDSLGVYDT